MSALRKPEDSAEKMTLCDAASPLASAEEGLPAKLPRARSFEETGCPHRGRFQLDRDRILYSASFRKLQYKTQVFVTHEGDLYRTRMTHTIEVMQIARSLAGMLGLSEMLAEAIALAHDIGHPAFGHGGEEALNDMMAGAGGFDHNLQGLRVVDRLEQAYPAFRGLNLCWETREGIARHYTVFDNPPELPEFALYSQPSAECQVVDAADTIAFCTHDLDDAIRIGLARPEWLERKAEEIPLVAGLLETLAGSVAGAGRDLGAWAPDVGRARAISGLINALILDVVEATRFNIVSTGVEDLEGLRALDVPLVAFSPEVGRQVEGIAQAMLDDVYTNPVVYRMHFKGGRVLRDIFEAFVERPRLLPDAMRQEVDAGEELERTVCDYIAGMTDRYAMDVHAMLFQPYARTTDWF